MALAQPRTVEKCGLEYFAGGPNAGFFAPAVEDLNELLVPTLSVYEVFKRILQQRTEDDALAAVAVMQQGRVVELSSAAILGSRAFFRPRRTSNGQALWLQAASASPGEP
ncbi:MAG: hypothetical protein ACE5HV_07525 [Acidobacteriota bacterium]